ncbi:sodium channel protein type 4 subunit alpha B-like [Anoplopoma fimbria]|uniref:sodium channel protein type 4 subunit alpha B-like n=1 Tax=Anoplopoma fimbria TaxID=229290 RepID=UPI0023ECBF3C|nr:sodium channel protein type 4 subunit alpha B-like [Anoplopoma fimbria]
MTSRKMSFFEMWRSKKERGELLKRANQLRLRPPQLRRLLGDSGVRAALKNTRMASLLPPVGTEVFRRLTPASLRKIQQQHEDEEMELQTRKRSKEVTENDQPKPASDLEAGKPLPFFYGNPPPELQNTPLEELDPFYQSQKTFIVLSKDNIIHRFDAERACYLLSPFNPLRTVAIKILTHSLFSLFIMVTIMTNCVLMTMCHPPGWSKTVEHIFTAIYTFEAIMKVVSRGFCVNKFTFLRDPWNWLDVMVIITGLLTEFVDFGKVSVLRTVPRVLKIIPVIPGLRMTVGALVQSLKGLASVIVLMVLCLSVLALIGLQLFMGNLKSKCVILWPESTGIHYNESINNSINYYFLPHQYDALLCGNSSDSGRCPEGFTCLKAGNNPNYGYTNFDSFGWSLLSVVRLMTKDFWENLVQMTLRAAGKLYMTFFVLVVFPGCFCVLSLTVAVVAMASSERDEDAVTKLKQREEDFGRILEAIKRREEEEQAACRAALSPEPDGENTESMDGPDKDQRSCPPCWSVFADCLLKWNCCGCWRWLKQGLYIFTTSLFFELGVVICLILNIIFTCMEHFPMTEHFERMLSEAQLVFTMIFIAEMVLKLVAMDPYGYFQVGWNIFDSIIVAISLLELSVVVSLRLFVVMRVFRLARWWPSFHMLIKVIWTSVRALRNLCLFLLVMVFIFSLVGMQLFQQDYKEHVCRIAIDCQLPRWHMNDFFHSFLVIIRALCGEWIDITWDCMEVSGPTTCLIFFLMVLVIGNLLVLNLFLTLLLSSFTTDCLEDPEEEEKSNLQIAIRQINRALGTLLGKNNHVNPSHPEVDTKEVSRKKYLDSTFVASNQPVSEVKDLICDHGNLTSDSQCVSYANEEKTPEDEEEKEKRRHPEIQQHEDSDDQIGDTPEDCCSDKCYHCCPFLDVDTSHGRGRVWSNFRRACFSIVQHKCFKGIIISIILLSSAALVFEDIHLQHRQVLNMVLERADQVFTCFFLIEMILKWIAFGLKKYFSDAGSWVDFLILQVYLVSLAADTFGFSEVGAFQSLRTFRALGLLRVISRIPGPKVVVQALVRTGPSMFNFLLVSLVLWMVFSIVGVNLFAGKFQYCFNETSEEIFLSEDVNNQSDCLFLMFENFTEVRWKNAELNYDNVLNGFLTLLHLGASSDCSDVMYSAVDTTWVDSQPVYDSNMYMYLYFICFTICNFFTFNYFIRVIIDNLQRDKSAVKPIFMTKEQQEHGRTFTTRLMKPQKLAPRPQNCFQAQLFDLVTNRGFRVVMAVVICLNMVTMMVETDQQSQETDTILYMLHFVFIVIFFTEFILKIIALRKHYFTDGWNILDFVVISVSIIGLFFQDLLEKYFCSPSLVIVLRVVHIFRIFYSVRGIGKLLNAFMMSLPALFNIVLLLFIIHFTSSIFGMLNFAYVKREYMIDDMFNFETFGSSMICLLMMSTSASWGGLLSPMMKSSPDCEPDMENPGSVIRGNCGSPAVAIVFLVTHICLTFLLVVHLYIAVILETFKSEDAETLSDDDFQMFYKTWKKFDPEASQFIQYSELSDFCDALQDPLRIPKSTPIKLTHMDLPLLPEEKIHCSDVLHALSTQVLGDSGKMNAFKAKMEEKFMANLSKMSCEPISSTLQGKQEDREHVLQQRDDKETAVESEGGGGGGGVSAPHCSSL